MLFDRSPTFLCKWSGHFTHKIFLAKTSTVQKYESRNSKFNSTIRKKDWHSTSDIYICYANLVKNVKPLGERQVSNILTEIKNSGLVVSSTASHGRGGYGTQFKITVTPNVMGNGVSPEWWKFVVLEEIEMQKFRASYRQRKESGGFGEYLLQQMQQLDDEVDTLEEETAKYRSPDKMDDK